MVTEKEISSPTSAALDNPYESLFQDSPSLMWIFEPASLRFLDMNRAVERFYGYTREQFLKLSIADLLPLSNLPALRNALVRWQAAARGKEINASVRLRHTRRLDGTQVDVEMHWRRTTFAGTDAVLCTLSDVTDQSRTDCSRQARDMSFTAAQSITGFGVWQSEFTSVDDQKALSIVWSEQTYRILGYVPNAVPASTALFVSHVAPEDRERLTQMVQDAVQRRHPYEIEYHIRTVQGEERIVYSGGKAIDLEGGGILLVNVILDVTDRRHAQENREQLASIVNSSEDAIVTKTISGTITGWNPGAEKLYGYRADEIIGRPADILLEPEDRAEFAALMRRVADGQPTDHVEATRLTREGRKLNVSVSLSPLRYAGGRISGICSISRDMTDRIQMERMVRQSEKMSGIGKLAAGVAHELNNPLNVILGYAQSAARTLDEKDTLFVPLQWIKRETLRCRDLIQNLLNFARDRKPAIVPGDLRQVFTETAALIETQARVKRVTLATNFDPLPPTIPFDRVQMQQLLINLCTNAIDAMPQGGKLTIDMRAAGDVVEISIADTGTGIPEEVRQQIFEPFFTTKDPGKGTGLGLSLAYETVQNHHGQIKVDSVIGQGTTFTVRIPMTQPSLETTTPPHPVPHDAV